MLIAFNKKLCSSFDFKTILYVYIIRIRNNGFATFHNNRSLFFQGSNILFHTMLIIYN